MKTETTIAEMLAENRRLIDALDKCRDSHFAQTREINAIRKNSREEIALLERELDNQRTETINAQEDSKQWQVLARHLQTQLDDLKECTK